MSPEVLMWLQYLYVTIDTSPPLINWIRIDFSVVFLLFLFMIFVQLIQFCTLKSLCNCLFKCVCSVNDYVLFLCLVYILIYWCTKMDTSLDYQMWFHLLAKGFRIHYIFITEYWNFWKQKGYLITYYDSTDITTQDIGKWQSNHHSKFSKLVPLGLKLIFCHYYYN